MTETSVNDHTIHVCGLQRSGHHPVMQWIMINSGVPVCFLNDCEAGTNPYDTANMTCSFLPPGVDLAAERGGRWARKQLLMCSYEDRDLGSVYPVEFRTIMDRWIGPAARTTHVLILRDPFNLIASKYRWAVQGTQWKPTIESLETLPELWKAYAREFLAITSFMPAPCVRISYNRWFTDASYRRTLAETLGISIADEGREMIARWGPNTWGDSFDNMTYDGRATEMKVLERWQQFVDEPRYRALVCDPELRELSAAIFGAVPGSERLLS